MAGRARSRCGRSRGNRSAATTSNGYANWSSTLPLAVGANPFTATATDSAGNTQSTALTFTRQVSTQNDRLPDAWKTANGLDPSSSAAVFGPGGDPEFDGLVNLLEYAFNRDPQAPDGEPVQSTSSGGYFQVSYPRRIGAFDLTYTVEISDDLATWSSAVANYEVLSIAPNGDDVTETVTVRVLPAMSGAGKKFFHVKVTTPPP